jgi:hypothetical protein
MRWRRSVDVSFLRGGREGEREGGRMLLKWLVW